MNKHCLVDPPPEVTLICSCDFSARRDFFFFSYGEKDGDIVQPVSDLKRVKSGNNRFEANIISCLADSQRCTHTDTHTHSHLSCMHALRLSNSKQTNPHTSNNKYIEEKRMKQPWSSVMFPITKTSCRQTATECLPFQNQNDHNRQQK